MADIEVGREPTDGWFAEFAVRELDITRKAAQPLRDQSPQRGPPTHKACAMALEMESGGSLTFVAAQHGTVCRADGVGQS